MPHYVGIDLGTTNSVICSYDGEKTQLHKSPEQTEVTPSAIYFDSRGRYYGLRAYQMAAYKPEQTATVFNPDFPLTRISNGSHSGKGMIL